MKKDARSISHESKETLRLRAVKAVIEKGKKQNEVAELFGVTNQAINGWIKKYRAGGYRVLKAKSKGRPVQSSKLKPWQASLIVRTISDKTPDMLKFPFMLWTRDAVAELIKLKFDISLSRWSVGRLLKKWGFTPQKPAKKSYFQNPQKIQNWLDEEYPEIVKQAKKENAEIQWLDEMGARSDDQVGRTYSKKGKTPEVIVSGIRFSCNFISTITNLGKLRFMSFKERFTTDVFLKFLQRLTKNIERKIYLILDSHPVHKSRNVMLWLKENKDKIQFFFLPPYSPELNPTEYLNQDVKTNALRKKRAKDQKELIKNVSGYLRKRQKTPGKVKKYFHAEKVKYAA